jgi:2'-5' RNA ligase
MKKALFVLLGFLGFIAILAQQVSGQAFVGRTSGNEGSGIQATNDQLIAIDILLEPDQTMVSHANAVNATLRGNLPSGYSLDATHAPHVTLLQRFIHEKDLPTVTAALSKIYAANPPTALKLKAQAIDFVMWNGVAVTVYVVERTPELMRLHEAVIKAVEPLSVSGGTGAAFVGTDINAETIGWVEDFVPKSSGPNYIPHVTLGIAKEDFASQLKAAPFTQFTFSPVGAAVYHLGNFGTAAKKLWKYQGQ